MSQQVAQTLNIPGLDAKFIINKYKTIKAEKNKIGKEVIDLEVGSGGQPL